MTKFSLSCKTIYGRCLDVSKNNIPMRFWNGTNAPWSVTLIQDSVIMLSLWTNTVSQAERVIWKEYHCSHVHNNNKTRIIQSLNTDTTLYSGFSSKGEYDHIVWYTEDNEPKDKHDCYYCWRLFARVGRYYRIYYYVVKLCSNVFFSVSCGCRLKKILQTRQ